MAELHPPEGGPINAATTSPATTATTTIGPVSADNNNNTTNNLRPTLATKRQRRPSVRLGEIGDQPATISYDSHSRRPKPWRFHKDPGLAGKSSKTRPLTNLVNNGGSDCYETLETEEDNLDFGNRKPKSKMPNRRVVRTNWTVSSKIDDNGAEGDSREDNNNINNNIDDDDDELRDFEPESPLKEQSPVHSIDNVGFDSSWHGHRRTARARVCQTDSMPDSDSRGDRKCGGTSRDGVRNWLIGLGLGRYAPVFEIHEVDDQVLPMLTLEDLKDMGINAVGSRRKIHSAIQKLGKGFS